MGTPVRYVVVDSNNQVTNAVMWDGGADWDPPTGTQAVQSDTAAIGDSYDATSGTFTAPAPQQTMLALATLQQNANAAIDAVAGTARATYITVATGQGDVYRAKYDEAVAYKAAGYPTTYATGANGIGYFTDSAGAKYYYMAAAVKSGGNDPSTATAAQCQAAAGAIIAAAETYTPKAASIEAARLSGKAAVNACTAADPTNPTTAEAQAVTDAQDAAVKALEAL